MHIEDTAADHLAHEGHGHDPGAGSTHAPVLVTSSWYAELPDAYCRIGISRGTPRGQRGFLMYRKLQPGPYLKLPDLAFTRRYYSEVLAPLDAATVLQELQAMAGGRIPALLCFEHTTSDAWCHRGMVSAWFKDKLGIDVPEFSREGDGCGSRHPKLCDAARAYHEGTLPPETEEEETPLTYALSLVGRLFEHNAVTYKIVGPHRKEGHVLVKAVKGGKHRRQMIVAIELILPFLEQQAAMSEEGVAAPLARLKTFRKALKTAGLGTQTLPVESETKASRPDRR